MCVCSKLVIRHADCHVGLVLRIPGLRNPVNLQGRLRQGVPCSQAPTFAPGPLSSPSVVSRPIVQGEHQAGEPLRHDHTSVCRYGNGVSKGYEMPCIRLNG